MHTNALLRLSATLLLSLLGVPGAQAQCTSQWLPGAGLPGINGYVHTSVAWDPDGAGPQPTKIVFGGGFYIAGDQVVNNLAVYDPTTSAWSPLGTGMNNAVYELAVAANGDLVAGGYFTTAGGVAANYVARWNGSAWSPLGPGPGGVVTVLAALANGDIAVGAWDGVKRWNGSTWSMVGAAESINLSCLAEMPNGNLIAGGNFTSIAGVPAVDVAQWNGTAWSQIGGGIPGNTFFPSSSGEVLTMCVTANGDLVVGGTWYSTTGTSFAARWDGTTWSAQDAGLSFIGQTFLSLRQATNGDLIAGGRFELPGHSSFVVRWNGASWSHVDSSAYGAGPAATVALLGRDIYAAGGFEEIDGLRAKRVARWDGTSWQFLAAGTTDPVVRLTAAPNGDVIAIGSFQTIEGVTAENVARWNGSTWIAMNAPNNGLINAVCTRNNGDVLIGGTFSTIAGNNVGSVTRWNGTTWVAYGANWPQSVYSIVELANGSVAAGGSNGNPPYYSSAVTVWDGSTGTPIPNIPGSPGTVRSLAELPAGPLLIATSGSVVSWDGARLQPFVGTSYWSGIGWNPSYVHSMVVAPSGHLIIAGYFNRVGASGLVASGVASFDGTVWSPLGAGVDSATDVVVLPDGDLAVVGPTTAGGAPVGGIARWNGTAWSTFGAGTQGTGSIGTVTMPPAGPLFVGGTFFLVGGNTSPHIARLDTTCPALAASHGTGCPSSGGSNTLVADTPPWVDATFQATGTGLPTNALVLTLTSVTSVPQGVAPLASIFVEGVPGCDVLVAPDILAALITTTGTATSSFLLPNAPPIVGVTFFHQMVPFELGGPGIVAITATNALQLTAGMF